MGKIYAVREGFQKGIFTDWASCQQAIKGYSGAEFKSFKSTEEATRYLNGEDVGAKQSQVYVPENDNELVIITKGTYDAVASQPVGIFRLNDNKGVSRQTSFRVANTDVDSAYTGELCAVLLALGTAVQLKKSTVKLYYTFEGVEKWYVGEWLPKNKVVSSYIQSISTLVAEYKIAIHFERYTGSKIKVDTKLLTTTYDIDGIFSAFKKVEDSG